VRTTASRPQVRDLLPSKGIACCNERRFRSMISFARLSDASLATFSEIEIFRQRADRIEKKKEKKKTERERERERKGKHNYNYCVLVVASARSCRLHRAIFFSRYKGLGCHYERHSGFRGFRLLCCFSFRLARSLSFTLSNSLIGKAIIARGVDGKEKENNSLHPPPLRARRCLIRIFLLLSRNTPYN